MKRPRLPQLPRIRLRKLRSATLQIVVAGLVMMGGGALIGLWVVGLMLIVAGLMLGADALLRDDRKDTQTAHEDILDLYRRAR